MLTPDPPVSYDPLNLDDQDKVVSIAYDFYGSRLATCSLNQTIRVYDLVDNEWQLNDAWKAHEAAVSQISWAPPQHPTVLASSSYDCTVRIWEENINQPKESGKRWEKKSTLTDFKGPVYDVGFCPQSTAMKLAAIASDGVIRIYELLDPGDLDSWSPIFELHLLNRPVSPQLQSSFCISWSPSALFAEWLAVGALDDIFIFKRNSEQETYDHVCNLSNHRALVRNIAWAPSLGRSTGLIATACKDGFVRIYSLDPKKEPNLASLILESDEHGCEVWRVSWNPSGTVLASTGDRGEIRYWKSMFRGSFKSTTCVDELHQLV